MWIWLIGTDQPARSVPDVTAAWRPIPATSLRTPRPTWRRRRGAQGLLASSFADHRSACIGADTGVPGGSSAAGGVWASRCTLLAWAPLPLAAVRLGWSRGGARATTGSRGDVATARATRKPLGCTSYSRAGCGRAVGVTRAAAGAGGWGWAVAWPRPAVKGGMRPAGDQEVGYPQRGCATVTGWDLGRRTRGIAGLAGSIGQERPGATCTGGHPARGWPPGVGASPVGAGRCGGLMSGRVDASIVGRP